MSEKRKPYATLLLKKEGKAKSNKVEMFRKALWENDNNMDNRYRLRVNGKWFPEGEMRFFTKTAIKEMFFRNL